MILRAMIVAFVVFGLFSMDTAAFQKTKKADKKKTDAVQTQNTTQTVSMKSSVDSLSYALGVNIGSNLLQNITMDSLNVNTDILISGITTGLKSSQPALSQEQIMAILNEFQQKMQAKNAERMAAEEKRAQAQQEAMAAAGTENKKKGEAFLAQNKTAQGVMTTASGLQYKVEKEGTGKSPKETSNVTVHYTGKLLDGKVFDSSVDRGQPATFPLNRVIKGWTEGLQLMKEGSKFTFYIPSDLAYGEHGAGGSIGPNETLIFEVELIKVEDSAPAGGQ